MEASFQRISGVSNEADLIELIEPSEFTFPAQVSELNANVAVIKSKVTSIDGTYGGYHGETDGLWKIESIEYWSYPRFFEIHLLRHGSLHPYVPSILIATLDLITASLR